MSTIRNMNVKNKRTPQKKLQILILLLMLISGCTLTVEPLPQLHQKPKMSPATMSEGEKTFSEFQNITTASKKPWKYTGALTGLKKQTA